MVPNFSVAAPILAATDLLRTVPSVAMSHTAAAYHIDRPELPFDIPDMALSPFRSASEGDEPGVRWSLQRVAEAFSLLDDGE